MSKNIIIVISSSSYKFGGGMDKVIYNAHDELKVRFKKVTIVSANSFFSMLKGVLKIISNSPFGYDFIIFNSLASFSKKYNSYWKVFYYLSKILNITKVIYWHEMPDYFTRFKNNLSTHKESIAIEKKFKNKNILHLCCSKENSKIAYLFDKKPTVIVVHNCIKPNQIFNLHYSDFTVISVGSIQNRKGTDLWTDVAIKTCKINKNIKFIWCGGIFEYALYAACISKIKENNLENNIYFLGQVEDAKFLVASSHLFYLSSREDTFALSTLEAMSYGKNVVHYQSGGVEEQVSQYGICVENFDLNSTVEVIINQYEKFLLDPASVYNHDLYNRFFENYTPEIFAEKLNIALS